MKILLIAALLLSCNKHKAKDGRAPNLGDILIKRDQYLILEKEALDDKGWVKAECDSLMMTCLQIAGGGASDWKLAMDNDGRLWRTHERHCLSNELSGKKPASRSTISRDMILSCLFPIWRFRDIGALEKIISYGEKNNWIMGEHDGSPTGRNRVDMQVLGQTLRATIYELRFRMGGADHGQRKIPQVWTPQSGFSRHLQMLHILIRGLAIGSIDKVMLNTAKANLGDEPANALYHAIVAKFTDGQMVNAVSILDNDILWPEDRLPTSGDRCKDYLFMHDKNDDDWLPCDEGKTHAGTDLNFTAALMLGELD